MRSQRIVIEVTCDHCPPGESADVTVTRTVGYGSARYEIDLCQAHGEILDKTMTGITGGTRSVGKSAGNKQTDKKFRDDCRAWARQAGYPVSDVGIIPAATMDGYREYLRGQVK